ncbi:hypothetical protein EDC65_4391 [Stella humosa]|uniref:Uncharacterized protein n=1 Tax=Stella humosa TaxID=94 RepID=A0A3N1KWD7_9PROT|nr:amino acid transporter [Stella humosa]ROP83742.1 hypothetical protein EDC65_4391 [Stella humosa]BBK32997.1 hypothetical protein STHU_36310 [Stella humosa]
MSLIQNEQAKLTGTFLNGTAIAALVAGTIAPFASLLYGVNPPVASPVGVVASAGTLILVGVALHILARSLLRKLKQ